MEPSRLFVAIGVVVAVVSLAATASAHQNPEDRPVDEDIEASGLLLTLSDMQSTGWRESGDGEFDSETDGFQDGHDRQLSKAESSYEYRSIEMKAYVFNTLLNASQYYHDQKNRTQEDWSTEEKSWGDEAYYWETVSSNSRTYIRDDNIVWWVERNRQGHYTWDPSWEWVADTLLSKYSPPNAPPDASFSVSTESLTLEVDASASTDSDGSIENYRWTIGEGVEKSGVSVSHTFEEDGNYTVRLVVVDDKGARGYSNTTVNVSNRPPTAHIDLSTNGRAVEADGTQSEDPDGSIASYDWEWGDNRTGSGPSTTHIYRSDGTYTVTLRVTDDVGESASASRNVTVQNLPPTSDFEYQPSSPSVGDTVQFTDRSKDPDTDIVERAWDFGDGNSSMSPSPAHTFASPGNYSVTLSVTDSAGAEDSSTQTVRVTVQDQGAGNGAPTLGVPAVSLLLATVAVAINRSGIRQR